MDTYGEVAGNAEANSDEECGTEVFVRAGWAAKFRGVLILKSTEREGTYVVQPLPRQSYQADWQTVSFDTSAKSARLVVPDSVRITNRAGRIPEIELRPTKPGDLGWSS